MLFLQINGDMWLHSKLTKSQWAKLADLKAVNKQ